MKPHVHIHNNQSQKITLDGLKDFTAKIWISESCLEAKIDIILVDNNYIKGLNQQFLNKSSETDVLAFPLSESDSRHFEGEIYISVAQVKKNANECEVSFDDELRRMVTHGLLHFLGYDDQVQIDRKKMSQRENYYLKKFKL